jgi:hypothetical protein
LETRRITRAIAQTTAQTIAQAIARLVALLGAALLATPASAAPVAEGAADRYAAAWFANFAPRTAFDMIERLPGFVLEDSQGNVRGFAQAAGNLVINGQRPSIKNESLTDLLTRIPADRVQYVELLSGDSLGGEYRGRAQVANVVLHATRAASTQLQTRLERAYTGRIGPDVAVSHLRRTDDATWRASLSAREHPYPDYGTDLLRDLASQAPIENRDKFNDWRGRRIALSAGWERARSERDSERANVSIDRSADTLQQRSAVSDGALQPLRSDTLRLAPRNRNLEIGADFARPFGNRTLKIVALTSTHRYETEDLVANYLPGQVNQAGLTGGSGQNVHNDSGETVLRAHWNQPQGDWVLEFGGEAAYNQLHSRLAVFSLQAAGERTPIDIPGDDVKVSEQRAELSASAGRDLPHHWHVDLGLTAEHSRLQVRGDTPAARTLRYWKPSLALSWRDSDWRVHLLLARSVAQLNFGDFASFAEVSNDRINAGNASLVPQQVWQLAGTIEHSLGEDTRAMLVLRTEHISELQDRVPLPGGFDGPGNLGDGRRYSVEFTWDSSLAALGMPSARLRANGFWQHAAVRDPYTGVDRPFSDEAPRFVNVSFRQTFEAQRLAWGLNLRHGAGQSSYRQNEIDAFELRAPTVDALIEYRHSPRVTAEFGIENLLDAAQNRSRRFYSPDRFVLQPAASELRVRHTGRTAYLRLAAEFG